jgi:hypothetical protein
MLLSEIIDHPVSREAILKSQGTYVSSYGVNPRKETRHGWELLIEWRDGSSDWVSLKDLKDSYLVELAMYAQERKADDEPAFACWVPNVLRNKQEESYRKSSQRIEHALINM